MFCLEGVFRNTTVQRLSKALWGIIFLLNLGCTAVLIHRTASLKKRTYGILWLFLYRPSHMDLNKSTLRNSEQVAKHVLHLHRVPQPILSDRGILRVSSGSLGYFAYTIRFLWSIKWQLSLRTFCHYGIWPHHRCSHVTAAKEHNSILSHWGSKKREHVQICLPAADFWRT